MGQSFGEPSGPPVGLPFLRKVTPARRLEPSLDGAPLEVCLELLHQDHAPDEAANHVARLMLATEETRRLLTGPHLLLRAASHLTEFEDLDSSLQLIGLAKRALKDVALLWLRPRTCLCCIEARQKLEKA